LPDGDLTVSKPLYEPAASRSQDVQLASDPTLIVCAALVLALLMLAGRIVHAW